MQTEPARSAPLALFFPTPDMQGVPSTFVRPLDAVELKRTDQAACPMGFLIQAYGVFSVAGRAKFRPLASHGTPWRHSKIPHRCDTRKQCRSGDHKRGRRRVFWYVFFP